MLRIWPQPHLDIKPTYRLFRNVNRRIIKGTSFKFGVNADMEAWPLGANWDPSAVYVLIHGWVAEPRSTDVVALRSALLLQNRHIESVVIDVDWRKAAYQPYRQSAANTIVIGVDIGALLFILVQSGRVTSEKIHVIGMDMSAHIATYSARYYTLFADKSNMRKRIGRVKGLAPLLMSFDGMLSVTESHPADKVDNIHTSAARAQTGFPGLDVYEFNILNRRFGFPRTDLTKRDFFQVDFYPNFGDSSSQCPSREYGCTLNLATAFFKASLMNGYNTALFTSHPFRLYKAIVNRVLTWDEQMPPIGMMGIDADRFEGGENYLLLISRTVIGGSNEKTLNQGFSCVQGPQPVLGPHKDDDLECGLRGATEPHRIFQGLDAKVSQFPWAVCILAPIISYSPEDKGGSFKQRHEVDKPPRKVYPYHKSCTGSLIKPGWVITAAHCFWTLKNGIPIYLVFGSTDCLRPRGPRNAHFRRVIVEKRKEITSQTIFYHAEYPNATPDILVDAYSDIVLIRLQTPVKTGAMLDINTICWGGVAHYHYDDCSSLTVAGYGNKGFQEIDGRLTWMRANVVDLDTAKHAFLPGASYVLVGGSRDPEGDVFDFTNFDYTPNRRSACRGDSGGPVMDYHLSDRERATLVGVVNKGPKPCEHVNNDTARTTYDGSYVGPGFGARIPVLKMSQAVKVSNHLQWIRDTINGGPYTQTPDAFEKDPGILGGEPEWDMGGLPVTPAPPSDKLDNILFPIAVK